MKIKSSSIAVAFCCALLFAGCAVGPNFKKPANDVADRWAATHETASANSFSGFSASPVDAQWWRTFGDSKLASLVNRVANLNLDVQVATARLAQARAARQMTGADALPSLDGSGSYQHDRSSQNGVLDISGLNGKSDYNLWQPGLDASWELDLWGRVRREIESSNASLHAVEDLRRDVLLSVISETARDYIALRGTQQQQVIVAQNLDVAKHSLALIRIQFADGVSTQLEIAQELAEVAEIEGQLPVLHNRYVHSVNALSFLVGEKPDSLEAELSQTTPIPSVPPTVPLGLPSSLAERRPDIREAEARLHAATAQIGVAIGDFYPKITLSANFSVQAQHFSDLDEWSSRMFGVGPSISIPLFEGARLKGQLALRKAQQQEAAIHFQRTVLNAWEEVDNAMSDYTSDQAHLLKLQESANQNQSALDIAQHQYVAGVTGFLNVLVVQKSLLSSQEAVTAARVDVSLSLVRLYKTLGGGWESILPLSSTNSAQRVLATRTLARGID